MSEDRHSEQNPQCPGIDLGRIKSAIFGSLYLSYSMKVPLSGFCLKREMLGWFMTEWIVPDEKGGILYRQEHQDEESTVRSWRFRPRHQASRRAFIVSAQLEHMAFTKFYAETRADGTIYEAWIDNDPRLECYCPHASQDTDLVLLGEEIDALFNIASRRPWFRF